jgi:predicted RNA-binding protein with PIN domain
LAGAIVEVDAHDPLERAHAELAVGERHGYRRPDEPGPHVAVAVGVGVPLVVLPVVVDRRDVLHHAREVGVAPRLELDHGHATRGVGHEHGANAVPEAGVGDGLLRVFGDVDRVVVAARVEREFLASCMHVSGVYEVSGRTTDVGGGVDLAVPDPMVLPLIEVAADVLRGLDAEAVPASLKALHGFDRRGLLAGPAPRQLRRALLADDAFRERVVERFLARSEVTAMLDGWTVETASSTAEEAAGRGDLPLYAAALYAARPEGYAFGLGIAVVLDAQHRQRQRETAEGKSEKQERAALEEARRRADAARIEAETAAERAEQELQKERTARRTREDDAIAAAGAAQRQVDALQTQIDQATAEVEEQQNNATRASQRVRALEADLKKLRADTRELRARAESAESRLSDRDARALVDASALARQLSVSLDALDRRLREGGSSGPGRREVSRQRDPAPMRRTVPQLPGGVIADSPAGVEAMLGTPDVVLIIDGYNVGFRAWGDATPADQRERLGIAATALCRKHGCEIVLVFDGDGSGRPALRRGGVRVLFSDAGEEADEVVVREVENRPRRIPVVVASSDSWVREHAREQGAMVVGADAFVRVIRPDK